jgi:hypothetical protein
MIFCNLKEWGPQYGNLNSKRLKRVGNRNLYLLHLPLRIGDFKELLVKVYRVVGIFTITTVIAKLQPLAILAGWMEENVLGINHAPELGFFNFFFFIQFLFSFVNFLSFCYFVLCTCL